MQPSEAKGQIKSLFDSDSSDGFAALTGTIDYTNHLDDDSVPPKPVRIATEFPSPQLDQWLPIASSIEATRLRARLQTLADHSTVPFGTIPISDSDLKSQILVARWCGNIECTRSFRTKLRLNDQTVGFQNHYRPADAHLDLVWTGSAFELRKYRIIPSRGRCQLNTIMKQSLAIRFDVVELSNSLILVPKDNQNSFGFHIELSSDGTASLSNMLVSIKEK